MTTLRPWMPLYVADYLADTAHLSAAQSGGYVHLILHYWLAGRLPNNEQSLARIARMSPAEWKRNRDTIAGFFGEGWSHKRVDKELARVAAVSTKRRTAAQQMHSNRRANADASAVHMRTHFTLHTSNNNESISLPSEARPSASEFTSENRDARRAIGAFNAVAAEVGWPLVQAFSPPRVRAIRGRLKDAGGMDGWLAALAKARGSPFLCGDNDRGWRLDFDFLCQRKNFTKLMEGGYDQSVAPRGRRGGHDEMLRALAEVAREGDRSDEREASPDVGRNGHVGAASAAGGDYEFLEIPDFLVRR